MARIRTLNFLPEVFQTPSNAEFLAATLDQIVNPPNSMKIQGYVGSKLGYGVNANDKYVPEPTKERTDYQLDPGVVFTKTNESTAKDFITYPGMVNAVNMQGGITDDNSRLFKSQFYSWDSFCDLDKLINYNQYYWLPNGAPAVTVAAAIVYQNQNYVVTDLPNGYSISLAGAGSGSTNPTLTLLRGGTYTFAVNQNSQFWIQGEPGTSGYSATQPNLPVRDVYGVSNNGATDGVVTFTVPAKDAQNQYDFPINNVVDVVSTMPFDQVNGQLLSDVGNIDGVTSLEGLRVVFYDTGVVDEIGYTSSYYGEVQYDTNDNLIVAPLTLNVNSCDTTSFTLTSGSTSVLNVNNTVTFSGTAFGGINIGQVYYINDIVDSNSFSISLEPNGETIALSAGTGTMTININQGLYEEGYYSTVADNYYRIQYVGATTDPVLRLVPDGTIIENEKITPAIGVEFANRPLFKNSLGGIQLIPYITAPLNILYYQDGTSADKVGIIRVIDSNYTNTLNVVTDILGKKNFTSTNGVAFTNGLKVQFDGDIIPTSYLQGEYYVQGVGAAIELVPVNELVIPEKFSQGEYNPWDMAGWDIGNYDIDLYLPILEDYITIARNSISRNAWSRSNRWFHIDVINATAQYNNNPETVNLANGNNKAKRPIIEFYPNLKLWNSGAIGKAPVDFIDMKATDALSTVPDSLNYYPDIQVYTTATATIDSAVSATSTTVTVPVNAVTGTLETYMYIGDSANILPNNAQITALSSDGTDYTMTVTWEDAQTIVGDTGVSLVASVTTIDNYALFPGARVVFAADTDRNVRNKIYVAEFSTLTAGDPPVITLTVAEDGDVLPDTEIVVTRGYTNRGLSFWFDGLMWVDAQEKLTVNQPPLFNIYDKNGISLGDNDFYSGTSFAGCKLFAYGIGTGTNDPVLGFPIRYSAISNVGDISFDVSLNADTFSYVLNGNPYTDHVNIGYVYNYTSGTTHVRQLGWENAIAASDQYQVFEFEYDITNPPTYLQCDIAALPDLALDEKGWPRVKVFYNNTYQYGGYQSGAIANADYTYAIGTNTTTITLINPPTVSTPIQVLVLSDQVSNIAYYDVPINLTNNPLNEDLTVVNIGDIRLQYRDIFINSPLLKGKIFGANNYRDCGDLVPYGTEIIQNSAAMVLPGAFLRNPAHNLFDSLLFNSREYIKFKQLLVDTVQNTDYVQRYTPATILDSALDQIAAARSEINAFFWSDMLPSKTPYLSNTYTFNNDLDHTIYPLSQVYDFDAANYNSVLVYLQRTVDGVRLEKQLLTGFDYVISTTAPSLQITIPLLAGDKVIIKEYNQTYGSYVPNTPTKLGVYPAFEPSVVLDSDYMVPTYFILGHDGSYTKLYGDYNADLGILVDFRDQALLEFETRIYNNLKLSGTVPIRDYEILPGYFRQGTSTYTYDEFLEMYSPMFLNWVGQNRLDYKTQYFSKVAEFTYNYTNSAYKTTQTPISQGYWRGVYSYLYDTTAPNETPWEMLGFSIMPDWWETRYGPTPYTSDNGILWADLEAGYVWNNGDSYIVPELARPGLSAFIPVDSAGNLLSPFKSVVGNYNPSTFQKDWKVGDMAPVELSYRRSSTWPFDLVRLFALTRPAEFFNLAVDLDLYKYNTEFNQYLVNDRRHLQLSDIQVYGNGTPVTSYINWIVDYEKQQGIDATTNITDMLNNMDVRLIYRLAGYSDKTMLNFYVEKGSPNSRNASLLIPDESYSVLLYENQPFDKIMFSGVIIQQNQGYWTVYGNSQNFAYFTIQDPLFSGQWKELAVENQKVKVTTAYQNTTTLIPYGTKFYSTQDVAQFLLSYGAHLESQGMVFDEIQNGVHVTWQQMVLEFLYWTQTGWENGSIITVNPAAQNMDINAANSIVQPLTIQQQNFILNQNLYPIQLNDLCVNRDGTNFHVHTLNAGDTMAYGQFNMSNFEHGIVFDNVTLFNDILYSTVTGLRQNRVYVRGTKTAEWNGTVDTWGFILNQDNVQEWNGNLKYTKGVIVKYKNKYWTSLKLIEPAKVFNEQEWKQINYSDIQKGLLANPSTRAYESTLYYDAYEANLEQDADLLSFSLIGYRPRDYLSLIDLTDTAQVQVYKNMIKNKGTRNAVEAFKGANLPQGGIKYDVYENWAIQSGSYGGTLNENFVDFKVNEKYMTGDPSIVSLTNGMPTEGSMQEIALANLFNYGVAPTSPNVLSTTTSTPINSLYPSAGYVNYDDVKMASYFYAGLPNATDVNGKIIPIQTFYVGEYMWLANFKEKWNVYRWKTIGQVLQVRGNSNGTATITFNVPHGLKKLDPMSIINFASNVDGYYLVSDVVSLTEVIINLSLVGASNGSLQGRGLGFAFESQRVPTPAAIAALNLTENEFIKNTVWVDENYDGSWAVYRKSINYLEQGQIETGNLGTYGSAVAYTATSGYLISDPTEGEVYRYSYNDTTQAYDIAETLTGSASYGTAIAYANNTYVISQPTTSPRVLIYTINNSTLSDDFLLYQAAITAPGGVTDWGSKLAISDDSNWLYISALDDGDVYVYRRQQINLNAGYFTSGETYVITSVGDTDWEAIGAIEGKVGITFVATGIGFGTGQATQVTYKYSNTIAGSSTDAFGSSLSTTNRGNTLVVGAPNVDYSGTITNWGAAYVYARTEQNREIQTNSVAYQPQTFTLAWTSSNIAGKASTTVTSSLYINVASNANLEVNMPIVFTGTNFGSTGIQPNTVYYVAAKSSTDKFSIKTSRNTNTAITLTNGTGLSFTAYAQSNPMYFTVNGVLVQDNNYATIGDQFYYFGALRAGDIVNVSDNQFYMIQELNSKYTERSDSYFGTAVDITKFGSDVVTGSPFEIDPTGNEGAVYSFINGGAKYGVVIGTEECNVTTSRTVLINGFEVQLTAGNATAIAQQINNNNVINVQAAATTGNKLIIQLIDNALGPIDEKLVITVFDNNVLSELGIQIYTNTQVITCPHGVGPTQFGTTVKINEAKTMLVSAPVGTRYEGTFFDFTDDENLDNDTVFDNNATQFVDSYPNAGAVYMFDYLSNSNESLAKPGAFTYAQSINDTTLEYGQNPGYGLALDFNDNVVMVGSPTFQSTTVGGKAVIYTNTTGITDWIEYRQSAPVVDINKIQNTQLYSASTNETLVNFDYPDPLQNKLLGAVRENLDYVTGVDPANYNVNYAAQSGMIWGAEHIGKMWFNTTNVRWLNYHQNDVVYNSRHWAQVFPGSDVAVYTWIASYVLPVNYQGPGVPYDVNQYAVNSTINSSGVIVPIYYFWVRNTNLIAEKLGKTLSDTIVASYIANPRGSGIPFMAPLLPNTFAMYNSGAYFNANDSVFHVGYANGTSDDVAHNEYSLIRTDFADDFLPGLPSFANGTYGKPYSLYAKMLDSLAGADQAGAVVPNPLLPLAVQQGVLNVPRQSFFYDRYAALNNYLSYANTVMARYPITELKEDLSFLYTSGEFYNTPDYWEFINWWAIGYNNSTQTTIQVSVYGDLSALTNVPTGTLVKVEKNGAGKFEVYHYDGDGIWTRVGLQSGTIQFKNILWDYSTGKIGFSGNFFSTDTFDSYPSEETRNIIRALNEQIYTGELLIHRNKSLILLFDFIQAETIESQNFLPWLNKTSLADVSHTIRELLPYEVYKTDDQVFLSEYINEVKPYHVVIKDFLFNYTGTDVFEGDITDFDVPATYDSAYQQFISPQLVYTTGTNSQYQRTYTDNIWQTAPYTQWFQNYGLSMGNPVYSNGNIVGYVGQENKLITTLRSYVTRGTKYMLVDNAHGFPINGVVTIGTEKIGYSYVDRSLNLVGGLVRGVDGTTIADHLPSENIYMDLPSVLLLNGGRGYTNPPRITAVIDTTIYPEPTVAAEFEAVMNLDSVLQVNVINPGKGYAVLPEIVIEPAIVVEFTNAAVISRLDTLSIFAPDFRTGDLVQYKQGTGVGIGGLRDGAWYYINVLESAPSTIIALYTNYGDAIDDQHRVDVLDIGTSTGMTLSLGAKAIAITESTPTRELSTTIKFDRTTYGSQVLDWQAGTFYGAFFAGSYYNTDDLASTNITLENTNPDINTLLASAHSVVFEVVNAENERTLTWSSFVRTVDQTVAINDVIRLTPLDDGSSNPNASGTTIGFYINMPVKFGGATVGGIVNDQTYYVSEIINETDFTISESIDGPVFAVSSATATVPMYCYTGQVVDQAVLTVNYPGIMNATTTTATTNAVTIPLSAIGTGGTNGFYPGITLFFTATNPDEAEFGNLIENQVYYVNTIIDEQSFTISEVGTNVATNINNEPFTTAETHVIYSTTVTETATGTNIVTVDSTADFAINDRIIFNSMVISGSAVTSFGNIVSGSLYYVSEIISDTEMTISSSVNGAVFTLGNATGTAMVTNQKNTVTLTTATGLMTTNVALPVSPGQVNGQQFSMYQTSQQYPDISTGAVTDLLNRTVYAAIGTNFSIPVNRLSVNDTTWFYTNMPFQLSATVGGLSTGTTYYVKDYSGMPLGTDPETYEQNIYLVASATIAGTATPGTNKITCSVDYDTSSLYEGMGIVFSGVGLGGIEIGQEYFVSDIVDSTHFTISETSGGAELRLTTDAGTMAGTGTPWITVAETVDGAVTTLTTDTLGAPIELDQIVTATPTFDMSYILGGYRAIIQNGGEGFAITNTISISGALVGGTSPANDITMTVNTIDENGAITSLIISGTPAGTTTNYYFKIRGSNQFEVYTNSLMTIPASGLDFPYVGFTETTATASTASNDRITVADSTMFEVNDPVVFTGTIFAPEITLGQTYYIKTIPTSTTVTLSETPTGATLNIANNHSGSMTMAKAGSFAFLSEPFYFAPSIIRFNNRLYTCLVSNNDTEFVIGKWELIDSGDRNINAMDRVIGYYQPTVNMPGVDLTQLFTGVTYPNATYMGNAFEPDMQFDLDVVLQDQAFYPTDVQLNAMVYTDGYYSAANLPDYSALVYSAEGASWLAAQLTSSNVNLTDIVFANDTYIMTSTNPTTPIYRSSNGRQWTTNGTFTPWGSEGWSETNYDSTSLDISALSLQSAAYFNGWIAVGDNIVRSDDTYSWVEVKTYPTGRDTQLYGVTAVESSQFTGAVAVGQTTILAYDNGLPILAPVNLITWSADGVYWVDVAPVTSKSFYSVAANDSKIIATGENGILYYSYNAADWFGLNEASVTSFSSTNNIISISPAGFQLNDAIKFSNSFSSIVAGTTYYVKSIVSPTLITISATPGGATKSLSAGTVPTNTIIYSYGSSPDLHDMIYADSIWMAVGDNGTIKTSSDGIVWTTQTSGTTANLNGVTYATELGQFIAVGDNNTIITSDDLGVTWESISLFEVLPATHVVKGADFPYGYGPEELVPGVVRDNLAMTVTTRPGTNWPVTQYAHTGYNVISTVTSPSAEFQTDYSFETVAEYPSKVFVQVLNATTELGTTLYEGINYTVNWQDKLIVLNSPIALTQQLRIDVYEVGNGDQIVKSSTDADPIRTNDTTGFNEIYVNCNYSDTIYNGSGIIRPGTFDRAIIATATQAITNRITCDSVLDLVLGEPITFSGDILGGLEPITTYYIKTISVATNTITVSNYYDVQTGVAGATTPVTTDSGTMYVNVSIGSDQVWTDPILYNNGVRQIPGYSSQVTQTVASTNSIVANSTGGLAPDAPIMFSNTMFGTVIQPLITYYVKTVLSATSFTISETQGGSTLPLEDALGGAEYIAYDYAFGIQPNGTSAKIVFPSADLNGADNYIVYSLFGETTPEQYGYTIPITQLLVGDGTTTYDLTEYLGEENPEYAIVEINGLRITPSQYTIDSGLSTITFGSAPAVGDNIAVTSFNDTSRQYMTTQTNTGLSVIQISDVNNNIAAPLAITLATATTTAGHTITAVSTANFVVNQPVEFRGTGFGGIATDGTVYFIETINGDGIHFTIKDAAGVQVPVTTAAGSVEVIVGGQAAVRVTTATNSGFTTNDLVRIDGVEGSTQLNNNTYYVRVITPTVFDLYTEQFSSTLNAVNYPVTQVSNYISGGFVWETGVLYIHGVTASATDSVLSRITVSGDTEDLVPETPIYFAAASAANGDDILGGLIQGTEYYVHTVYSTTEFSVSDTRGGDEFPLSTDTGTVYVTQWAQFNTDRLWVTVNGKRVPSSKLALNDFNELSILTPIASGDTVVINSMVPSATPNQEVYLNMVDNLGVPSVYRELSYTQTYLTQDIFPLSTTITVNDVRHLINIVVENATAPVSVNGYHSIGLTVDKRMLSTVTIVNNTTGQSINSSYINVSLIDASPIVKITAGSWISEGDSLTITSIEGNVVYVNGEQITFSGVDLVNNQLTGIGRGANGTAQQYLIPTNTTVVGLLNSNKMPDEYYNQTWNSYIYNTTEGDPLQISETPGSFFLNPDNS